MFAPPFFIQHSVTAELFFNFSIEQFYKKEIPQSLDIGSSFFDVYHNL
jgi:hypothetical protein